MRTHAKILALIALLAVGVTLAGCSKGSSSKASSGATTFAGAADAAGGADQLAKAPAASASSAASGAATAPESAGGSAASAALSKLNLASTAQIKIASLTVAAKDVNAAANSAIQMAASAGGGVAADSRTAATAGDPFSGSADLTLKVPPDQLEPTLTRLDTLGTERSRTSSTQDVTEQVADVNSRVASAQASIAQLQALFSRATAIGDVVNIEGQLAQRQADLESLQAQQRALSAQTSFATITLSLVALGAPVVKTKPADHTGFVGGLASGWHAFTRALGWGLTAVGAVLPFALLAALIGWGVLVVRRRLRAAAPASPVAASASGPGVVE